jgi:hypothetical protein
MKRILVIFFLFTSQIGFSQMGLKKFIVDYIDTSAEFNKQLINFFYKGEKPKHDVEIHFLDKKIVDTQASLGLNIKTDITDSLKIAIKSSHGKDYIVCKYSVSVESEGICEVYIINKNTIKGDPFLFNNFLVQFFLMPGKPPKVEYIERQVM